MRRLGVLVLALLGLLPAAPAAAEDVVLKDSWPREDALLWVPPREGHLEFSAPVVSSSLELELTFADGDPVPRRTLERLTSEQFAEKVIFRIPVLAPGEYVVVWKVESQAGPRVEGSIPFEVDEPLIAAGGQNHRHGENAHLYQDSAGEFALRVSALFSLLLLFAVHLRHRRRGASSRVDRFAVRVGAVVTVLAALVHAVADVVAYVDEFHDYPLSAALAAPAVGVLPLVVAASAYLVLRAPTDRVLLGVIALLVAVNAGLGHLTAGWWAVLLYVLFVVAMGAFVVLGGTGFAMLVESLRGRYASLGGMRRLLGATWLALAASSFGMLFLHAKGFDLQQDFRDDLLFRTAVSASALVACGLVSLLTARKNLLLRLFAVVVFLFVVSAASALLWMPPPAAGL